MVKIITFEGSDYSGKTTTYAYLAKKLSQKKNIVFNEGPIYQTGLTSRLLVLANQSDELEREFLYTMTFALDSTESSRTHSQDGRIFIQDRYWPSVIAYGKFLNKDHSIHNHKNFRPLFIPPTAVILFSCSSDEKVKRSSLRGRRSVLDNYLLGNPEALIRLEAEIERSLEGLPNILRLDTTNKTVEEAAQEIESYSVLLGLI